MPLTSDSEAKPKIERLQPQLQLPVKIEILKPINGKDCHRVAILRHSNGRLLHDMLKETLGDKTQAFGSIQGNYSIDHAYHEELSFSEY